MGKRKNYIKSIEQFKAMLPSLKGEKFYELHHDPIVEGREILMQVKVGCREMTWELFSDFLERRVDFENDMVEVFTYPKSTGVLFFDTVWNEYRIIKIL